MKSFRIEVPRRVYYPGETIRGCVEAETAKQKDYHAIKVTLTGHAEVEWRENKKRRQRNNETHSSHVSYIYTSTNVWERDMSINNGLLPAGINKFPFNFKLDGDDLPPSYSNEIGIIVYKVEARVVQKSLLLTPHVHTQEIQVGNVVDIDRPDLLQPKGMEMSETISRLLCLSGSINISATVQQTGFCIQRDSIPVEVSVDNRSGMRVNEISVKLLKKIKYNAVTSSRTETEIIASSQSDSPIASHSKASWSTSLPIPFTEPTLSNCAIICISYSIEVSTDTTRSDNTIELPVVLGAESPILPDGISVAQ